MVDDFFHQYSFSPITVCNKCKHFRHFENDMKTDGKLKLSLN